MAAPFKKVLLIDFESRYSTKPQWWTAEPFSLRNMTTEEYLRDKRFADFGAVLQPFEHDAPISQWYDSGDELRRVLSTYDWDTTAVVAHNAIFDVGILQWHYGIRPAFIFDTLSMSRALRGPRGGNGLADLAREFQLPSKGAELALTDGLHTLTPEVKAPLVKYCRHDVWLLRQVFKRLLAKCATFEEASGVDWDCADHYQPQHWVYPIKELRIIDMTVRMFTEPQLELDTEMLQEALEEERVSREALLGRLRITDADLASNDRFAEILRSIGIEPPTKKKRPTAKTPNPVGFNYAFAKTDAMFQAMLNGDDDNLSTLCEARLKVKSTTERTRAQRFLDISQRGALPVPVFYYGAQTGRFAAAKGQAINMQNLKRKSFLRKAIMAPKDCLLVVGDLSQIEPRVLGWLSDYEALLDIFRSGQDAYAMFGAQMFNEPGLSKESHPDLRQSAKSALLGCIAEGQEVLTDFGPVPIEDVKTWHRVWDGLEWVRHDGVIFKGVQDVITYQGLTATLDHVVYTEDGREIPFADAASELAPLATTGAGWRAVRKSENSQHGDPSQKRRNTRSVPMHRVRVSAVDKLLKPAARENARVSTLHTDKAHSSDACAESLGESLRLNSAALHQPSRRRLQILRRSGYPTVVFEPARIHRVRAKDTPPRNIQRRRDRSREKQRALRTGESALGDACAADAKSTRRSESARVWKNNVAYRGRRGGASEVLRLSVRAAIRRKAVARRADPFTNPRAVSNDGSAQLAPQRAYARVYDILNAGPRHRFTVSNVLVHNCGYQLGWASFAAQLLVGFLGAPPVRYDKDFARKLGVNRHYLEEFLDYEENRVKMGEIARICTDEELIIHCVSAKKIIDIYRSTAEPVTEFWKLCQDRIVASLVEGEEYQHKCLLFRKGEIVLPNGMSLLYPDLRQQKDEQGRKQWVYGRDATKLYAGKVTNNVTQALARIVMTDGMLRVNKRYPTKGTVHDELIALAHKSEAQDALPWVLEQMTIEPVYMPGIPLAADGGIHRRYGLAKD